LTERSRRKAGRREQRALVPYGKRALPQIYLSGPGKVPSPVFLPEPGDSRATTRLKWLASTCIAAIVGVAAFGGELATRVDGKPRLFNRQKAKMGEQEAWTCTHDAARADFGYAPEVAVEDGVARAYAWYREHGWM